MTTEHNMIHQLNHFRAQYYKKNFIHRVVYNVFNKYYTKPTLSEGIDKILEYKTKPIFSGNKKTVFEYYF